MNSTLATETKEKVWTIKELAEHLSVSRDTVEREIERRGVVVEKIGRLTRISDSEAKKIRRPKSEN